MDLGFNLAQSNRDLKDPTSRQNFGDTSGLLCKNDPILRLIQTLSLRNLSHSKQNIEQDHLGDLSSPIWSCFSSKMYSEIIQ